MSTTGEKAASSVPSETPSSNSTRSYKVHIADDAYAREGDDETLTFTYTISTKETSRNYRGYTLTATIEGIEITGPQSGEKVTKLLRSKDKYRAELGFTVRVEANDSVDQVSTHGT
ncbi:uncharacterized protein I206_102909 [Kwoniella pini CBS 10737]|uniref:Uncharacterized protein n=1 Tax=Kwoniella pini CBS 10737 TaxID=1296096 RepID=A0A1B9I6P2_9TREE|nr:uncharacterized protein I206_03259 [Kwoniella pini CBS 10737]OCF51193.1 hypothetical protein I206_03259 [Kwoniella pini CBS 10737]